MAYASAVEMDVVQMSRSGNDLTPLSVTPDGTHGNKFWNNGKPFLMVTNGSGGELTVTLVLPGTVDDQAVSDRTVAIADGQTYAIGPFTKDYNQSDGYVHVTWSTVSSVTAEAISL